MVFIYFPNFFQLFQTLPFLCLPFCTRHPASLCQVAQDLLAIDPEAAHQGFLSLRLDVNLDLVFAPFAPLRVLPGAGYTKASRGRCAHLWFHRHDLYRPAWDVPYACHFDEQGHHVFDGPSKGASLLDAGWSSWAKKCHCWLFCTFLPPAFCITIP